MVPPNSLEDATIEDSGANVINFPDTEGSAQRRTINDIAAYVRAVTGNELKGADDLFENAGNKLSVAWQRSRSEELQEYERRKGGMSLVPVADEYYFYDWLVGNYGFTIKRDDWEGYMRVEGVRTFFLMFDQEGNYEVR